MRTRAKMYVISIEHQLNGYKKVRLNAIYSAAGENADFTTSTPSGSLEFIISPDRPAQQAFVVTGKEFYIDITPVEEAH